jgi:hypothetical protein
VFLPGGRFKPTLWTCLNGHSETLIKLTVGLINNTLSTSGSKVPESSCQPDSHKENTLHTSEQQMSKTFKTNREALTSPSDQELLEMDFVCKKAYFLIFSVFENIINDHII